MPTLEELRNGMRAVAGMPELKESTDGKYGGGMTGGGGATTTFVPQIPLSLTWDYIQNTPLPVSRSFTEVYADAKKQGLKQFLFNGRPIAVVDSQNPNYTKKEYETAILNLRKVLDHNKKEIPDSTRIEPWVGQTPGIIKRVKKNG